MKFVHAYAQKLERTFVSKNVLPQAVRTLSVVAPRAIEAYAAYRFAKPSTRRESPAPVVAGLEARAFTAGRRGGIAAWSWGGGPVVMLVHGWNGVAAQLAPFVAPLVEAGYRVVAFDHPAHGRSHGESATIVDMAEAARAVASSVGPVHALVAHSLGAAASAVAMRRGLAVERAVFLAPPAEVTHFIRGSAAKLGLSPARVAGLLARIRARVGEDFSTFDVRIFAPSMRAALMVMHDPKDREVPFEHGRAIAEAWPGARFVALERLGHTRMLADAAVIERAVRFVREPRMSAPAGAIEGRP